MNKVLYYCYYYYHYYYYYLINNYNNYWIRLSQDMKNYADQGGCYQARQKTPSTNCTILHIVRKPNSIIVYNN